MIFDPRCKCSHARNDHENDEKCRPSCGCGEYRMDVRSRLRDEPVKSAATGRDCQQECDPDCEIGPVHCWNRHRPNHKPDWHDGTACDAGESIATANGWSA